MLYVALTKILLRLFALLPLRQAHLAATAIGYLLIVFDNDLRRTTYTNIKLCFPTMTTVRRRRLVRTSLIETAKTMVEMGPIWFWPREKLLSLIVAVTGAELLAKTMAQGNGTIIAAPHLGCWELIGIYCAQHYAMTILYRPPRIIGLNDFLVAARQRFGIKLTPTTAQGVRKVYRALQRGDLVGILPDQDPGKNSGFFAPFFGLSANTMTLLPRLARKSAAPVIFAYAERLPKGIGYHLYFRSSTPEIANQDLSVSVRQVNIGIESCIQTLPAQYQWGYKRFKTRPQGEKGVY